MDGPGKRRAADRAAEGVIVTNSDHLVVRERVPLDECRAVRDVQAARRIRVGIRILSRMVLFVMVGRADYEKIPPPHIASIDGT